MNPSKLSLALISVMFAIITMQTSAQKKNMVSGVVNEKFETKDGIVTIQYPEKMFKGKTISGKVKVEPKSDNAAKQKKQLESLYALKFLLGNIVPVRNGIFVTELPESKSISIQLINEESEIIEESLLEITDNYVRQELNIPNTIKAESIEKITGDFTGDITEANLTIDETPAEIIAGNQSELFYKVSDIEPGRHTIELDYGEVHEEKEINFVDYTLEAGRLSLNKGEQTYLKVKVEGLENIQEALTLNVINKSENVINLEGGAVQSIIINPEEVAETGTWEMEFNIQSIKTGAFTISTDLVVPEEKQDINENNLINFIDEVKATGNKSGAIAQIKLTNKTSKPVNAFLDPCLIPSENNSQSFTVPERIDYDLPPNSEKYVNLNGFCNDFSLPAPENGNNLINPEEWIQIEAPDNIEDIRQMMTQEDIRKVPLTSLKEKINIPGTDFPVTHVVGIFENQKLRASLLVRALQQIIETYDQLKEDGDLKPVFSKDPKEEKEQMVQFAFWDFSEKLKGEEVDKEILEDKLEPQIVENLWENIELIGKKAKILPPNGE